VLLVPEVGVAVAAELVDVAGGAAVEELGAAAGIAGAGTASNAATI